MLFMERASQAAAPIGLGRPLPIFCWRQEGGPNEPYTRPRKSHPAGHCCLCFLAAEVGFGHSDRDGTPADGSFSTPKGPLREPLAGTPSGNEAKVTATETPVWQGYAAEGSSLAKGLQAIKQGDSSFAIPGFIEGARAAYELIVGAFASGQKNELKPLLTREVYQDFAAAIDARQKAGEQLESRLVGIRKADIEDAQLFGRKATVTIRFTSDFITARKSSTGEVLEGDPARIREIVDVWTFERDVTSRDPNWRLTATGSA